MTDLQINYLADVPQFIPTLAEWTYKEWSKYDPTLRVERIVESLNEKLQHDKIPITFVAVLGNKPVGMVSLKAKIKVPGYSDRKIWLGSYLVLEEYRNQGVGKKLLTTAFEKSKELGFNKISLFSSDLNAVDWYAKHGWVKFADDTYQEHPVALMEFKLD